MYVRMQEEGWVVCRAFKKRAMHPPRSVVRAWNMGYSCPDLSITGTAAHFKQEPPQLDGGSAAALLQYSTISCLSELPQLESPPPPNQGSHRGTADGDQQDYDLDANKQDATVSTDWRALDRFVASQLSPAEEHLGRGLSQELGKPTGTHAGDSGDASDIVALLLLDGVREDAGLLGSVASTSACLHKNGARYDIQNPQ
jgi:hypothetical protein